MLNIKKFKGSFNRTRQPTEKFQLVTGDYIQGRKDSILAVTCDRNGFVIKDLWTGVKQIYPSASRDEDDTGMAIADFIDDGVCQKFYADEALQIRSACKSLAITYEPSIPGRHETNAKIENTILDVERGTRSALIQAGFPPCFWSFAAPMYCLLDNTEYLDPMGVPYIDGSRWSRSTVLNLKVSALPSVARSSSNSPQPRLLTFSPPSGKAPEPLAFWRDIVCRQAIAGTGLTLCGLSTSCSPWTYQPVLKPSPKTSGTPT